MLMRNIFISSVFACALLLSGKAMEATAQDTQVTPGMFGLGDNGNKRSAEPSEVRVYPAKADGTADRRKKPWIGSDTNPEHKVKENEVAVYHGAIDITSRGPDGRPVAREFKAGVYGTVLASRPGFIAVQMADRNIVQYLHASEVRLKPGQPVNPDTILGETGNLGTSGKRLDMPIHLHIQVTNSEGKLVDPDRAILAGRAEKQDRTIKWNKPDWVGVGPMLIDSVKPRVGPDGVVKADAANKKFYYDETAPKTSGETNPKLKSDLEAFARDMAAFNRDVTVWKRDCTALESDVAALNRDIQAFNALPANQQSQTQRNRLFRRKEEVSDAKQTSLNGRQKWRSAGQN